jgi:hypothetical protein
MTSRTTFLCALTLVAATPALAQDRESRPWSSTSTTATACASPRTPARRRHPAWRRWRAGARPRSWCATRRRCSARRSGARSSCATEEIQNEFDIGHEEERASVLARFQTWDLDKRRRFIGLAHERLFTAYNRTLDRVTGTNINQYVRALLIEQYDAVVAAQLGEGT